MKRYLKPASQTTAPSAVVCLSILAKTNAVPGGIHSVATLEYVSAVGCRFDHRRWCQALTCRTDDSAAFWRWLYDRVQPGRTLTVVAYKMGSAFTLLGGWKEWEEGRLVYERKQPTDSNGQPNKKRPCVAVITDPPFILSLRAGEGTITFIDSRNFTDAPPSELATDEDIRCRQDEWEPSPGNPGQVATDKDARRLQRWFVGLVDTWRNEGLGQWRQTAAGLAWSSFKQLVPHHSILLDDHKRATHLARDCHFGGEARCFRVGQVQGPIYHLDVRAMYLSIMATWPLPCRRLVSFESATVGQLADALKLAAGAARVLVRSDVNAYPVRVNGKSVYATGCFWTSLCGPELEAAVHRGEVEQVERFDTYAIGRPTEEWAWKWWNARCRCEASGDRIGAGIAKLVGNSLSGKFAQYSYQWTTDEGKAAPGGIRWGSWSEVDAADGSQTRWRALNGLCQRQEGGKERPESWPIMSAFICSIGRERMRAIRRLCPLRSVFYQDTDGILCNEDAFECLLAEGAIGSEGLGDLRFIARYDSAEILATKAYRVGQEWKLAGKLNDAEPVGPHTWRQTVCQTVPEVVRRRPGQSVVLTSLTLRYRSDWLTETIGEDGWTETARLFLADAVPW